MCGIDADKVNFCIRDTIDLSLMAIQMFMCKVKDHVSAGLDCLPACFYKKLARFFVFHYHIFVKLL